MLQTPTPKAKFNRGSIHVETFFIKKFNFETGMNTNEFNFPMIIFKDGKEYKFEKRIFENQMFKWIYSQENVYQGKSIIIW